VQEFNMFKKFVDQEKCKLSYYDETMSKNVISVTLVAFLDRITSCGIVDIFCF